MNRSLACLASLLCCSAAAAQTMPADVFSSAKSAKLEPIVFKRAVPCGGEQAVRIDTLSWGKTLLAEPVGERALLAFDGLLAYYLVQRQRHFGAATPSALAKSALLDAQLLATSPSLFGAVLDVREKVPYAPTGYTVDGVYHETGEYEGRRKAFETLVREGTVLSEGVDYLLFVETRLPFFSQCEPTTRERSLQP